MKLFQKKYQGFSRSHYIDPTSKEIEKISEDYGLHNIVVEDITDIHTQDKVDQYDDHIFFVIHFSRYDETRNKYILNDLNVIFLNGELITISSFELVQMNDLHQEIDESEAIYTPYMVVYKLLDLIYTSVSKDLQIFTRSLFALEEEMFDNEVLPKHLLESLTFKRRNAIFLKHTFITHSEILTELHTATGTYFGQESDVYYEDLEFKIDKITNAIQGINENINSISDSYSTLMSIRTNNIVGVLTLITVVVGFLTLVSGIYGMNVPLPFQQNALFFWILLGIMFALTIVSVRYFRRQKRI